MADPQRLKSLDPSSAPDAPFDAPDADLGADTAAPARVPASFASAPRTSRKWLWIGLGAFLLLVTVGILGNVLGWFGKGSEKGVAVEIVAVESRSLVQSVTASGRVEPETEVKISPEIPGELIELRVREGDEVTAGQVLARIRAEQYDAQVEQLEAALAQSQAGVGQAGAGIEQSGAGVAQAQAQAEVAQAAVAQAEAQLARTTADLERQRRLLERGVIAGTEVDQAETQLRVQRAAVASARAQAQSASRAVQGAQAQSSSARAGAASAREGVASAQARLREINEQRAKTTITAPISGIVSQLNVEAGERVVGTSQMAGTELMRIARFDAMEVVVDVNENDIVNVQVGDSARVEVDAFPGQSLTGLVTEIAQSAQSMRGVGAAASAAGGGSVTNFRVKVRVLDTDGASAAVGGGLSPEGRRAPGGVRLRPGMNGTVDILTNRAARALSVPLGAVTVRDMNAMREAQQKATSGSASRAPARSAPADSDDPNRSGLPKTEDLQKVVFVVRDGRAVAVPVTTGIDDRTYVQVLTGLRAGDRVIVGPYGLVSRELKSGDPVRQSNEK